MSKLIKNACEELIDSLNTEEEVKDVLRKIQKVASSPNSKMKQSVKDLFIVSPSCKELSKIAKCYERIIVSNGVYPIRGTRTYLELAFPSSGKEKDYQEFFDSPRIAAATQNYFTGVFLVSFEQWKSANELIRDIAFKDLIQFVNDNKDHISFVFHVTPDFRDAKALHNELAKHLNICQIKHSLPDMKSAVRFIEKQLLESGIELDSSAKKEMKKLIETKLDVNSNAYQGYSTLERLASNLQFELYACFSERNDSTDESAFQIGKSEVQGIAEVIEISNMDNTYPRTLGFN